MLALVLAFIGTNVDGFSCFAAAVAVAPPRNRALTIFVAAGAFAVLLCVSLAGSFAIGRIGLGAQWFGLVPAGIGIWRLGRLALGKRKPEQQDWISSAPSIFSIVLATGADNVAVYAPLFALRPFGAACALAGAYLLAWTLGCTALAYATPDLSRIRALQHYLEPAYAVFFIAIGVGIVVSS